MLCHAILVCTIHCITEMIPTHCDMLGDLSDEVFMVSFWIMSTRPQKAIYHQLIIKKICVKKNVLRKPLIRSSGFPKSKTNFLPTVVTISFISNKTRHSYSKWAKKRLSWISKVLALFKKLQFTINSNKKIVPIGYCHKNRPFVKPHNSFLFQKNKLKISRKSWDQNYSKSKTM